MTKLTPLSELDIAEDVKTTYLNVIDALHAFAHTAGASAGDNVITFFSAFSEKLWREPPIYHGETLSTSASKDSERG